MSGRRMGLVVFLAALAVRCAVVLALGVGSPPAAWGDDADYDALARGMAGGSHVYANTWFPPGYPLLLALIYGAAGPSPAAVRLVQAVLSAATCWVIFAIGRDAFGPAAGGVAGLLLAFYPGHAYMAWRLMAETPFILLLALAVRGGQRAAATGSLWMAAAAGAALGVATLYKSNLALAAPLLLLWPAWAMAGSRRRRAGVLAAGAAACALLLAALPLANAGSPGRSAALLPGNGGPTLWWSNNPLADGYFVDPDHTAAGRDFIERHGVAPAALQSRDPFLRSRADRQLALAWIRENPGAFLQLAGRKLWNAFGLAPRAAVFDRLRFAGWLYAVSYGGLLPLILAGIWRSRRAWRAAMPFYVLLAASIAMTVACYGSPRFTLLVMPFLLIFAGAAVAAPAAWGGVDSRHAPGLLPGESA
jgi:4-amino-4-deoxy-L-arabinose transferase-like glycosyltransferase